MTRRKIALNGSSPADVKTFTLLWNGFISGSRIEADKQKGRGFDADRRAEAGVARALKLISEPRTPDNDADRKLKEGEQMLVLPAASYDTLVKFVRQAEWFAAVLDDVEDLLDKTLGAAETLTD